jgi:hypothetical protein
LGGMAGRLFWFTTCKQVATFMTGQWTVAEMTRLLPWSTPRMHERQASAGVCLSAACLSSFLCNTVATVDTTEKRMTFASCMFLRRVHPPPAAIP